MAKIIPGDYVELFDYLTLVHGVGSDYLVVSERDSSNGLATIKVDKVMRAGTYTYTYDKYIRHITNLKDRDGKVITLTKFK